MRVLAIDHGTKANGNCHQRPSGMIAQPLEFYPGGTVRTFFGAIEELILEKEVDMILVGMPEI
jgi:RNase H-fold protein (predicted Holliday junction resolvase)